MNIEALERLALDAGATIMAIYDAGDLGVAEKEDGSPVTRADKAAEAVILAGLAKTDPGVPIIAEEEAAAGRVPATGSCFFLVDPLDGTKEFINRNGEFTVNIALIEDGVPVAGIVYAPALGVIYSGSEGRAFQASVEAGVIGPRMPITAREPHGPLIAVGSRSHGSEATQQWLERFAVERFVSRGSSLKFCLVAAGEADIYPRLGRTMEWDTAAGDAVLRAAGGIVTTPDGAPFLYNKRGQAHDVDFANGHFVAFGDRKLAEGLRPRT